MNIHLLFKTWIQNNSKKKKRSCRRPCNWSQKMDSMPPRCLRLPKRLEWLLAPSICTFPTRKRPFTSAQSVLTQANPRKTMHPIDVINIEMQRGALIHWYVTGAPSWQRRRRDLATISLKSTRNLQNINAHTASSKETIAALLNVTWVTITRTKMTIFLTLVTYANSGQNQWVE